MACTENFPSINNDSEMEEGEILDDLDNLSVISSEEEFLLRQRLEALETYNDALESTKPKHASILPGENEQNPEMLLNDLSEISATELEDNTQTDIKKYNNLSFKKLCHKHKKLHLHNGTHEKSREHKKKSHRKRKLVAKVISESSEESDDEYRNKRQKLANAVSLNKVKSDTSTLKTRLEKMLCGSKTGIKCLNIATKDVNRIRNEHETNILEYITDDNNVGNVQRINVAPDNVKIKEEFTHSDGQVYENTEGKNNKHDKEIQVSYELIDLCSEDTSNLELNGNDVVDSSNKENMEEQGTKNSNKPDSDDDLESLRQHALKTKNFKSKSNMGKSKSPSEDDDSDTCELRLICLKSALLKKAIERKLKQKIRKRRKSQSLSLQDDLLFDEEALENIPDVDNNTDIESVDMDIGSDGDEKTKESSGNSTINSEQKLAINSNSGNTNTPNSNKDDELEEDEDLLRAKLLTSLSKNLPNLVNMDILNSNDNTRSSDDSTNKLPPSFTKEKKFIINLEDSDSEAEHEATKNLTKMHMKLSEQVDFQQKLDLFLKSTRMQVENTKLPDVVQQPVVPKPHVKYVPKAVKNLPKSEQIEYKNLVKRMAELEKIKQARQTLITTQNNPSALGIKETLKPRNVDSKTSSSNSHIEEKIAISRKNIAEESAKMLKLKEEGTKLSRKYKIVATELRNISTAITLNKKEQRMVQNKLSRIRVQHQMLLKSSNFKHSIGAPPLMNQVNNKTVVSRLQKENNPTKAEHRIPTMLKAVTVSVVNNLSKENAEPNSQISVEVDVNSNKKVVKIPKSPDKERIVNIIDQKTDMRTKGEAPSKESVQCDIKDSNHQRIVSIIDQKTDTRRKEDAPSKELVQCDIKDSNHHPHTEIIQPLIGSDNKDTNDYQSPLQAFGATTICVNKHVAWIEHCVRTSPHYSAIWEEDPNAVLCPYEVGGSCRDPGCKFLHPKIPKRQ